MSTVLNQNTNHAPLPKGIKCRTHLTCHLYSLKFRYLLKWREWLKFAATLAVLFEGVRNKLSHIYALLSFMFQSATIFGGRVENFASASSEVADSVVQLPS